MININKSKSLSFAALQTCGEYKHQLTISEMPNHKHDAYSVVLLRENGDGNIQSASNNSYWTGGQLDATTYVGGSLPHNNIQPSICVYFWRRLS